MIKINSITLISKYYTTRFNVFDCMTTDHLHMKNIHTGKMQAVIVNVIYQGEHFLTTTNSASTKLWDWSWIFIHNVQYPIVLLLKQGTVHLVRVRWLSVSIFYLIMYIWFSICPWWWLPAWRTINITNKEYRISMAKDISLVKGMLTVQVRSFLAVTPFVFLKHLEGHTISSVLLLLYEGQGFFNKLFFCILHPQFRTTFYLLFLLWFLILFCF